LALRFTSVLLLGLTAAVAFGQAFGRFGYNQSVEIPGLKVDKEGFVATDPLADKILYPVSSKVWKPTFTSEMEQVVSLSPVPGGPSKVGFNLAGLGFSLYFPEGIDLRIGSTGSPYLSWQQGSVGESIPTPKVSWLVLSFRDRQPAIVFGFVDDSSSLEISGKPGAWELKSPKAFKGWVRVGLPEGLEVHLANTAGALGRLAKDVGDHAGIWTSRAPKLLKTVIESDLHSVTATWHFDKPNAVVPAPAILAALGNYPLEVNSPTQRMPGWTEDGPIAILTGADLRIRFPVKRVPTGRSLGVGAQLSDPIGTVSPIDIASIAELAMDVLVADRDSLTTKTAEEASTEYVGEAAFSPEPWTEQQLPFDAYGHGIDLAAAHAFLMQATTSTKKATSESNSMLTSVCWRQDWETWRVWTSDNDLAQRSGAFAALAGALCPESERRLAAGMFQAGLSGFRGLNVWKRRQGLIAQEPKALEPLYGVRKGLFGLVGPIEEGELFALSLLSPIRIFSEQSISLVKQGPDYLIQWAVVSVRPSVITLATAYPIEASAHTNLTHLKVESALGFTELHFTPETAGICEIKVAIPSFAAWPGEAARVPAYSEIPR